MSQRKKQTRRKNAVIPRQPAAKKKQQAPRMVRPSVHRVPPRIHNQLCGLLDPFCVHAQGAKLPDQSAMRTLTVPVHARGVSTTNAAGNGAVMLLPNWIYNPILQGVLTGSAVAYSNPLLPAPRLANVAQYRIVSMGVIIRCISAPLTRSGMCRIRGFPQKGGTFLTETDTSAYLSDFYEDIVLSDAGEVAIVSRRLDITCEEFDRPHTTTPTTALTNWTSPGFGAFQVAVTGGPISQTVLDIETFINFEVAFVDSEHSAILCTPPPEYDHRVASARKKASSKMGAVFKKGAEHAGKAIAKHAAEAALDAVAGYVAGPPGTAAMARIVD